MLVALGSMMYLTGCAEAKNAPVDVGWINWDDRGRGHVMGQLGPSQEDVPLRVQSDSRLCLSVAVQEDSIPMMYGVPVVVSQRATQELLDSSGRAPVSGGTDTQALYGLAVSAEYRIEHGYLLVTDLHLLQEAQQSSASTERWLHLESADSTELLRACSQSDTWMTVGSSGLICLRGRLESFSADSFVVTRVDHIGSLPVQRSARLQMDTETVLVSSEGATSLRSHLANMPAGVLLQDWIGTESLVLVLAKRDGAMAIAVSVNELEQTQP
jgi:hypothetical protein